MSLSIERPSLVDPQDPSRARPAADGGKPLFGADGPSFDDLLDAINPLQHLPIIGTIYRALTGDRLSDGARLAGGALYGGPVGLVAAMGAIGYEQATGRGLEETAIAALRGEEAPAAAPETAVKVAAAAPEPTVSVLAPSAVATPPAQLAATAPAAGPTATPQLSPEAFDALMRSVNQQPQATPAKAAGRPLAWTRANPANAPVEMPPALRAAARSGLSQVNPAALDALSKTGAVPAVAPASARQASLELHDALRRYAQQTGRAPAP